MSNVDLCHSDWASLSELCFGKCTIKIPIEIKSDKSPHPKGFLTMAKTQDEHTFSVCIWCYKEKDSYSKIISFFVDAVEACTLQALLRKML